MRLNIQPKSQRSSHPSPVQQQSLSDDHLLIKQISQLNPNLPKPKLLKSCIRCRKHKTKCDAQNRAPLPCSSCFKKGCACKIDYVLPPQRSDNLKNLISQVDFIKDQYDTLSTYYQSIGNSLGVKMESFEDWKSRSWLQSDEELSISASGYSNQNGNNNESQSDAGAVDQQAENGTTTNSLINLIKLSDGSFISMDINTETNQLIINNNVIQIEEFDHLVSNLLAKLHHLSSIFLNSSTSENETDDSTSSISSPVSLPSPKSSNNNNSKSTSWFDLQFDVKSLFKSNKFLLIMLLSFYYPHFQLNFQLFLKDYLVSYYSIIETLNKSSNTSTYSANLLMNTLMNKQQTNQSSPFSNDQVHAIIFNKFQLRCLIDFEIFNSELFLKKLTELLFLNVIMNGIDANLEILNQFVKFVELNINNNRKKLNFDKTENLKFIEKFVQLLNLFQSSDTTSTNLSSSSPFTTKKSNNNKSNPSSNTPPSLAYSGVQLINEKNFLKFEELLLKDFEFFQKALFNDTLLGNNDTDELSDLKSHTGFGDQSSSVKLQHLSLFKPFNSSTNTSVDSISPSTSALTSPDSTLNQSLQFNNHELKLKYNRFIENWSNFFAYFESKKSSSSSIFNVEKLFIDDFLLELKVLNVSILIFRGFKEFQPLLYQISEHYSISDALERFINLFNNAHYIPDQSIEEHNQENDADLIGDDVYFGEFSCEKMKFLYTSFKGMLHKNHIYKESSSRMNDIQVILENVDWKKETTDDVLRKIGVI